VGQPSVTMARAASSCKATRRLWIEQKSGR
jgi:hypothetical protein